MQIPCCAHLLTVCTQALEYLKQTGHVNTYTFTKCLTEQAIAEFHNKSFPVAIVRPSIVVSPSLLALALMLPFIKFCCLFVLCVCGT